MRRILHIDMDAFFAAVELKRRPELRGKPLVIGGGGDPHSRGVVSTASYEARAFGVRSGMPLRRAHQLCPACVFLPVDFDVYAAESEKIKGILREFSPVMEDAGIDEAFLDVSGAPGEAVAVARAIRQRIKEATGLTCSIGIGPNKLLAKLASDMQKPDGLTAISEADIPARVWPLPVRKLQGVGPKTEQRLAELGIRTIGDLARPSEEALIAHFGEAHGSYLHAAARGLDDSPLVTHWEPKSISRETTFPRDVGDRQAIARTLASLTHEVVERLRAENFRCQNVTVKLRYADFATHTHTLTLAAPTDNADAIRYAAFACLQRFALDKKARLIGVRAGGLGKTADAEREASARI